MQVLITLIINKSFYKENVEELLLNLFTKSPSMKNFYPIQFKHLGFQIDHVTPKSIRILKEDNEDPLNTVFFAILLKHRELKMFTGGNKIT